MRTLKVKAVVGAATLLAGLLGSTSAHAALLLGTSTLDRKGDLTVIQDGKTTFEFLDLHATIGKSHVEALDLFGSRGFSVASSTDMTRLFNSFGFDYANRQFTFVELNITQTQAREFTSYVYNGALALGSFIDTKYGPSWSCVSINGCSPESFVSNDDVSDGHPIIGVYLVRSVATDTGEVPEPGSFALMGLGAAGWLASRRRKHKYE